MFIVASRVEHMLRGSLLRACSSTMSSLAVSIGRRYATSVSSSNSAASYVSRRALLYMPGDKEKMLRKGATLNVDCVCMDFEDAVSSGAKDSARSCVVNALDTLDFGRYKMFMKTLLCLCGRS